VLDETTIDAMPFLRVDVLRISRLFVALVVLIGVCSVAPAEAAATFPRIDPSAFQLVAGDTFASMEPGSRRWRRNHSSPRSALPKYWLLPIEPAATSVTRRT